VSEAPFQPHELEVWRDLCAAADAWLADGRAKTALRLGALVRRARRTRVPPPWTDRPAMQWWVELIRACQFFDAAKLPAMITTAHAKLKALAETEGEALTPQPYYLKD